MSLNMTFNYSLTSLESDTISSLNVGINSTRNEDLFSIKLFALAKFDKKISSFRMNTAS